MPVDPILVPFLGQPGPPLSALDDPAAFRAQAEAPQEGIVAMVAEPAPEIATVDDVLIPVDGGDVFARIYRPVAEGPLPVHIYLHGGGWTIMSPRSPAWDNLSRERAALAEQIVVSVDYRKGPEHKFPTAVADSYAAVRWVTENIEEFGGDATFISVGGASAGGNLAAAVALKARDENGPAIAFQVLECPALDLRRDAPFTSRQTNGGYMLSHEELELSLTSYLTSPDDALHPYASPLLADDLSGLPPALIISAEYDLLADDGPAYAKRLEAAGVPVHFVLGHGHTHQSPVFTKIMPGARVWRDEVISGLRTAAAAVRS